MPLSPEFSPRKLDGADARLITNLAFIFLVGGGTFGGLWGVLKIAEAAGGIKHPLKAAFVAGMPLYGMIAGAISSHLIEKGLERDE